MQTSPVGSQSATAQEKSLRKLFQTEGEKGTRPLRHLFGPAALVATICLVVITALLLSWDTPASSAYKLALVKSKTADLAANSKALTDLFDYQLKDYKSGLARLDTYLSLQALFVATTILVIIRRSDSLNLFGNSIPLSWLHFFIPILLVYLWLASGYIVHNLIWARAQGYGITNILPDLRLEYNKLFRDAGWIDGWFISFIDSDPPGVNYSGIDRSFSGPTAILLAIVLGTLIGAAHASTLAMVSIGCRRYLSTRQRRRLLWYYVLPLVSLLFLLISHFLFAYQGSNKNWFQLYVAVVTVPLMAFLLWLSAKIDNTSYPETLECLRRMHQVTLSGPIQRLPLMRGSGPSGGDLRKTIALIGDSLSTSFHVSSLPQMLVRTRRGWKTNWFLTLPVNDQTSGSVLMRLSTIATVTGAHHASVSAEVDEGKRRSIVNHLTSTYHFSHQVDEVLAGQFPNLLLLWIGHNDVDWRRQTDSLTQESLLGLSNTFVHRYELQLRRLVSGALGSDNRSALVVFGLVNFGSFFQARADAEARRSEDKSWYPHSESAYKTFVSMRPEYRAGMIELAASFNDKLEAMCRRLDEQLLGTNVRLVYSDAMSVMRMDSAKLLSSVDAWHASICGHGMLADSAYPIVHAQAHFLGWDETNSPPG